MEQRPVVPAHVPPSTGGGPPLSIGGTPPSTGGGQQVWSYWPQLFVQLPEHVPFGTQQCVPRHVPPLGHVTGQGIVCPQLFVTEVWQRPTQRFALFGVQQVPASRQTSVEFAQSGVELAPQLTF